MKQEPVPVVLWENDAKSADFGIIVAIELKKWLYLQPETNISNLKYDSNDMGEPPRRGKEVSGTEEDWGLEEVSGLGYFWEVWCLYEGLMRILIDTCIFIHKDPSDHVIIAHAITEHLPLISDDRKFEFYKKQGLDLILNKKK